MQKRLFTELATRVAALPRFLGFDIANEIYWFTQPLKIDFTPQQGDAWMHELLTHCNRIAPGKFHVNGVDKWPYEDRKASGFMRGALARNGAAGCVHPWAGFGPVFYEIRSTQYGREALLRVLFTVHASVLHGRRADALD